MFGALYVDKHLHSQQNCILACFYNVIFKHERNHCFQSYSLGLIPICICTCVLHINYGVLGKCFSFTCENSESQSKQHCIPNCALIYYCIVFLFNRIACFSFIMVAYYKNATFLSFIVLEFLIMLLTLYLTNHFIKFYKNVIPLKRQGFPLQNFKMKMFIQRGEVVQTWFYENR